MRYLYSLLLLIPFSSFAQLQVNQPVTKTTVGEVKVFSNFIANLSYVPNEKDTTYTLLFRNATYQSITDLQSVSFSSEGGAAEQLYTIMQSMFSDENKGRKEYQVSIKLGETDVIISPIKYGLMFFTKKGYVLLNEKQLKKLFAKD